MLDVWQGFSIPVSNDGAIGSRADGIKPSKQALALVEKTTSLSNIEMLFFRAVKEGGESAVSLESMDLEYLLKINEYIDIQSYMEQDIHKQIERQQQNKR